MIQLPKHISDLTPYKAGQSAAEIQRLYGIDNVAKLASNENPLGSSPKAILAVQSALHNCSLYPDGGQALREVLAAKFGRMTEEIICHSGSDALIHLTLRTFLEAGDELISSHGTFIGFQVAAKLHGFNPQYIPQTDDYRFDLEAIFAAITSRTKIIYLANVNNPTGTYFTKEEFEWLIERVPTSVLVIMDEAYSEYSKDIMPDFLDSLRYNYPNMLTLRTFSKVYGLAGFRVGYGIANEEIVAPMLRTKLPFEPNTLGQIAAIAALEDTDFLEKSVALNTEGIRLFTKEFTRLGLKHPHSAGNFVMIDCTNPDIAQQLYMALLRKGFITRPLGGFSLPHCIRISTGTKDQNKRLIEAMEAIVPLVFQDYL
ncbi:MAG: histidinol-phosphate transaminase [Ignavibacteria bacterium]|nr:histidinol-phosphate transaminase [Ignavibacteria bacterium]